MKVKSVLFFVGIFLPFQQHIFVNGQDGSGPPPDVNYEPYTIEGTPCQESESILATSDLCQCWIFGNGATSTNIANATLNVEAVTFNDDETEITVYTNGIPNYQVNISSETVGALDDRPLAASDFTTGATTTKVGDVVEFGTNIGYGSTRIDACALGYWPPGPVCPESTYKALRFPTQPRPAMESNGDVCTMGLGVLGLFVNGVSIFGWSDRISYEDEDVWHNLATRYEPLDLDLCGGHASPEKEYHHHTYSKCLQRIMLDDDSSNLRSGHSPIIGLMGDGYFLYGYHQDTDLHAQSCWKVRDYSDPNDPLGCGGDGTRTCLLVDNTDPSAGTILAEHNGPAVTDMVESLSGNIFVAEIGNYHEDYYFDADCYAKGGEYLDEHNGHSHGDFGYHYHATEDFPYLPGPDSFYGVVADNSTFCIETSGGDGSTGDDDGGVGAGDAGDDAGDDSEATVAPSSNAYNSESSWRRNMTMMLMMVAPLLVFTSQ